MIGSVAVHLSSVNLVFDDVRDWTSETIVAIVDFFSGTERSVN